MDAKAKKRVRTGDGLALIGPVSEEMNPDGASRLRLTSPTSTFPSPLQPHISPDIADFFEKNGDGASVTLRKHGSTLAWLAHLDLLKHVVMSSV